MPLLTSLLILIVLARLMGQICVRFGQPAIVGEMLAGIVLGPGLLNIIHVTPALHGVTELAVFLVIVSAGLEMDYKDVVSALKGRGLFVAILSFVLPLCAGLVVGMVFRLDAMRTVFLALCVSITALPVAVEMLKSFNILNTPIGKYSIASAVVNDVLALLALGVILDLPEQREFSAIARSILVTGGKLVILGAIIIGLNWALETIEKRGIHIHLLAEKFVGVFGNEGLFGLVLILVLIFASLSEALGFHFVIGAFFGALLISKEYFLAAHYHNLERTISSITGGFLAPIFFATLGLEFEISALTSVGFITVLLVVAILSKILAGWLGGIFAGLSTGQAIGLGTVLNGRGVMQLVVAGIAFQRGLINASLFSTLVFMGIVTTVVAPILFKYFAQPRIAAGN